VVWLTVRTQLAQRYLGGTDDRLADTVTLGDAHLLRQEDLLSRYLDTEVAASDHDTVRCFQYLVVPASMHIH